MRSVALKSKQAAHLFSHLIGKDFCPDDMTDFIKCGLKATMSGAAYVRNGKSYPGRYWEFQEKDIKNFAQKYLKGKVRQRGRYQKSGKYKTIPKI